MLPLQDLLHNGATANAYPFLDHFPPLFLLFFPLSLLLILLFVLSTLSTDAISVSFRVSVS
jgi:hypothetical protein